LDYFMTTAEIHLFEAGILVGLAAGVSGEEIKEGTRMRRGL
jgi:hypothetical protein